MPELGIRDLHEGGLCTIGDAEACLLDDEPVVGAVADRKQLFPR
jgi:hypothetical protein